VTAPERYPLGYVPLDLTTIRTKLQGREAKRQRLPGLQSATHAAVAAILRPAPAPSDHDAHDADDTEVLLIRRALRDGDPWSGHMAFPGGHQEPIDPDLRATAMRETLEEVGLDLREHEYLGQLDEFQALARGRAVSMIISPHLFALAPGPTDLRFRPNEEVAELVWGRIGRMMRGEVDAIKELEYDGERRRLPAFQIEDHLVWGMTHSMLISLFTLLR
jgi:8-oxo-dGTP pyrophosphatase MutT (NUDIX family)